MKKNYTLSIEPLTAVHIGTGETLSPVDYVILSAPDRPKRYFKLSIDRILQRICKNPKATAAFENAIHSFDMKEFNSCLNIPADVDYSCGVISNFETTNTQNDAREVLQTFHTSNLFKQGHLMKPAIPGSSIKGAVRTALLSSSITEDLKENLPNKVDDPILQKKIFNYSDEKDDPLRTISFSDAVFSEGKEIVGVLHIIEANRTNGQLIPSNNNKIPIRAEMIQGKMTGCLNNIAATSIIIDSDLQNSSFSGKKEIKKTISIQDIITSCNSYYWNEFFAEYQKFNELYDISLYKMLKEIAACKNSFLIRVGRWSQIEYVTYGDPDFRKPVNSKGKEIKFGTTRTALDYNGSYIPMGWCKCTVEGL